MVKLSKPFYLGVLVGVPLLALIARVAIGQYAGPQVELGPGALILSGFEILVALASGVVFLWFWYRAWKAIDLPRQSNTPAERVLILLIPIVNIVWAFVAFRPWGKQYNEYLRQKKLPLRRVNDDVFFVFSWYVAMSIVYSYIMLFLVFFGGLRSWDLPAYVTSGVQLLNIAFAGVTTYYVCDAVNRLPDVPAERMKSTVDPREAWGNGAEK